MLTGKTAKGVVFPRSDEGVAWMQPSGAEAPIKIVGRVLEPVTQTILKVARLGWAETEIPFSQNEMCV